ncbi:hypothetical protein CDL15_Pgr012982 [Punica granatum]|uniref:Uncharacterized protein n=1 Tax=Punica granatum TaxID=22663 RepID=A0A218XGB0_PUNGR|nr:hypothetical protein CDL15_Pgr012982 [Punica granatum]
MDYGGKVVSSRRLDGPRKFGRLNGPWRRLVGSRRFDKSRKFADSIDHGEKLKKSRRLDGPKSSMGHGGGSSSPRRFDLSRRFDESRRFVDSMDRVARFAGSRRLNWPRRFGRLNGPERRLVGSRRFNRSRWFDWPLEVCQLDGPRREGCRRLNRPRRFGRFNWPWRRLVESRRFDWPDEHRGRIVGSGGSTRPEGFADSQVLNASESSSTLVRGSSACRCSVLVCWARAVRVIGYRGCVGSGGCAKS